jgi:tetratricopeptide (TPR) repeat protein
MARAAAKGRKRPQQDARRAPKRGGRRQLSSTEQTLFFSRIRRQARWAYILLAVVFAAGFAFLGVGSGNSDLTSLFDNVFHGGSSGPSISSAQKKIDKNPSDAKAWNDLATAYQDKGRTDDAIGALLTYTGLRPKDKSGLSTLASLQKTKAENLQQDAAVFQYKQQALAPTSFAPPETTSIGKALAQDPIQQAVQNQVSSESTEMSSRVSTAYADAINTYQRLAKLSPNDANVQRDLAATAEAAGNSTVAVTAYKRLAKLLPDQAPQIREKIKQLGSPGAG